MEQYLQDKKQRTPQENALLAQLGKEKQCFDIAFLSRAAIERNGYRADGLTDGDMEELAGKMGDDYCGSEKFGIDLQKACEDLGIEEIPSCPACGDFCKYDVGKKLYKCTSCGKEWSDRYVLVENPEQTDRLPGDLGYPCGNAKNSNARYIPEYDYIRIFNEAPEPNSYFEPVCYPESRKYLDTGKDSINALSEEIEDAQGISDFGEDAAWVRLCMLK